MVEKNISRKRIYYQIREGKMWRTCTTAEPQPPSGWLHYELWDGTIGLAPPNKWRVRPEPFTTVPLDKL